MTPENWLHGLKVLKACCKDSERTEEQKAIRGAVMLEDLGHLTDEQWSRAVAICRRGEWFPSTNELLAAAEPGGCTPISLAGQVYAEICEAYENLTGREREWSPNADAVEARWGCAARAAFLAVGGVSKFQRCEPRDEPFRLKAFREAFVEVSNDRPLLATVGQRRIAK